MLPGEGVGQFLDKGYFLKGALTEKVADWMKVNWMHVLVSIRARASYPFTVPFQGIIRARSAIYPPSRSEDHQSSQGGTLRSSDRQR